MGEGDGRHEVELSAYQIAKYPVTVAQYRVFVTDTDCQLDEDWKRYHWLDNHPVVYVSWMTPMPIAGG